MMSHMKRICFIVLSVYCIIVLNQSGVLAEDDEQDATQTESENGVFTIENFEEPDEDGESELSVTANLMTPVDSIEDEERSVAENLFLFQDDLVIQGVTNRQDYFFELPPSRKLLEGSYIELFFGHSPTLLPHRSTLTVLVNDLPIGSHFLDASNSENASWKLYLQDVDLEPGFQKVSLITHMEASSNLCEDQNNAANWTLIHKESLLHLKYSRKYDNLDLSWYPSPFLEKGSVQPFQTIFVVPDEPTDTELLVLGQMSAFFARSVASSLLEYQVLKESELTSSSLVNDHHIIWIGQPQSWGNIALGFLREAWTSEQMNEGFIGVYDSFWNKDNSQLFLIADESALKTAMVQLTDSVLYGQLSGASVPIEKFTPQTRESVVQVAESGTNTVTLGDLGYSDLLVESLLVGGARITYNIPTEWDIRRDATFRINFTHSKTLNYAQSLISVKVNQIPLGSQYLSNESSEFGSLEVTIPNEMLNSGLLDIGISIQFSSSGEACTGGAQIGNWAVIDNDSYLSFSYQPNTDIQLNNLPFPFVVKRVWEETAFILEERPSSEELSLFATMNGLLGRTVASYQQLDVMRYDENQLDAIGEKHLIIIGLAENIPPSINASENIPVRYGEGLWRENQQHIELLQGMRQNGSLVQLFPSPFNPSRAILHLSGFNPEDFILMNGQFTDPDARADFSGQVMIFDSLKRVHAFNVAQFEPSTSLLGDTLDRLRVDNKPIVERVIFIAVLVAVILLIGLLLLYIRRRKISRMN